MCIRARECECGTDRNWKRERRGSVRRRRRKVTGMSVYIFCLRIKSSLNQKEADEGREASRKTGRQTQYCTVEKKEKGRKRGRKGEKTKVREIGGKRERKGYKTEERERRKKRKEGRENRGRREWKKKRRVLDEVVPQKTHSNVINISSPSYRVNLSFYFS
jgi:hypothetical protein